MAEDVAETPKRDAIVRKSHDRENPDDSLGSMRFRLGVHFAQETPGPHSAEQPSIDEHARAE